MLFFCKKTRIKLLALNNFIGADPSHIETKEILTCYILI